MIESNSFSLTPLLERIVISVPADIPFYLTGGAVRDRFLGRSKFHDLDFTVPSDGMNVARRVADSLGAAYYPLDSERDTGRVILIDPETGRRDVLDFASLRDHDLESDLRGRDFTINAIAVNMHNPTEVFDPLDGIQDVFLKRIRPCSPTALVDDPVRVLRAVRQSMGLTFTLLPETRDQMRQAAPLLKNVSPERLRDELFRILEGKRPAAALRMLDMFGALALVMPELQALKGITQSVPHTLDVWEHTLDLLSRLETLLDVLDTNYDPDRAANLMLGLAVMRVGRYRSQVAGHLQECLAGERTRRALLFLAALYHDVAKPQTRSVENSGRIRFFQHEEAGAKIVEQRALDFHLSNSEVDYLRTVVRHHMRPLLLGHTGEIPSSRSIFRFFHNTGPAGVDICLLSMADVMAAAGAALPQEEWSHHLDVVRILLEGWWEKKEQIVSPPALINGHDLITHFQMQPGKRIGEILDAVREAQAEGAIMNREQAFAFVEKQILAG